MPSVFVSIVLWNSSTVARRCIEAVLSQEKFKAGQNLKVLVIDNGSSNSTFALLQEQFQSEVEFLKNDENLGFSAANNQAAGRFLESGFDYLFLLNPDVRLESTALNELLAAIQSKTEIGSASPKLIRSDSNLDPLAPPVLDACGMYMTPSLRHFDRGSGEQDDGQCDDPCLVFGGSGAALLLKRQTVQDLLLEADLYEAEKFKLYPALAQGASGRPQLFDEAFFAYREDADLAWRGQLLNWHTVYAPKAVGYHKRVVTPERRSTLPAALNALSVRNRFLLQLNNYRFKDAPQALLPGFLFRNLLVIFGVVFKERSSLRALLQVFSCWKRALQRRKKLFRKSSERLPARDALARWFQKRPYTEKL